MNKLIKSRWNNTLSNRCRRQFYATMTQSSHPDADVHPEATGPAKKIVDAHQKPENLKLYSGWFCPFVQRAWLVLEEKKIPYQYIEVNPYHKEESFLKLNPRGLVPTLQVDDKPLIESNVICEYLEEAYPDYGPKLLPEDLYVRARMRIWQDFFSNRIVPSFHRFLQYQPKTGSPDDEGLSQVRREFLENLKTFTKEMDPEGPYFCGKDPAMVDFVFAPWIVRLWVFDHFKGGLGIPEEGKGGADEKTWARWRKYSNAIQNRESVKSTLSDTEHYMPIYQRYAKDQAQSEMAKNVRSGRGVP